MTLRRVLWVLTAVYWAVIFTLTHLPPNRVPHGPSNDKLEHLGAYFVLSLMLGATLWVALPARRRLLPVIVFVAAALYGAFDEFTQIPVGRDAEFMDWCADISGAAAAGMILFVAHALFARRTPSDAPVAAAGA
jgi:VanZ family protein